MKHKVLNVSDTMCDVMHSFHEELVVCCDVIPVIPARTGFRESPEQCCVPLKSHLSNKEQPCPENGRVQQSTVGGDFAKVNLKMSESCN